MKFELVSALEKYAAADSESKAALNNSSTVLSKEELSNGSEFFKNMFDSAIDESNTIDIYESSAATQVLASLIRSPPPPPTPLAKEPPRDRDGTFLYRTVYDQSTVIPLPLLPEMLRLADKYLLPSSTLSLLGEHLATHAHEDPLEVYSLATIYRLEDAANQASGYIAPLETYAKEDIVRCIRSVAAYYDLLKLQTFRVQEMKRILTTEEVFPHGYRSCQEHVDKTEGYWKASTTSLVGTVNTHTDVAHPMALGMEACRGCDTCSRAIAAAIDMLVYKVAKIPKRINQLSEYQEPYDTPNAVAL